MPFDIRFKTSAERQEFAKLDQRLKFILYAIDSKFGPFVITRVFGDYGKHKTFKAVDLNPMDSGGAQAWREKVRDWILAHIYGVDCVADDHGTAPHLHIEVDPKSYNDYLVILLDTSV